MKKMEIYEPAMCCATGLCGVGVDPELLRVSTVINTLKGKGIVVERYNLSNAPQAFIDNKIVNDFINRYGTDKLPITLLEGELKVMGHYPSNEEFAEWLELSGDILGNTKPDKKSKECCCKGGKC